MIIRVTMVHLMLIMGIFVDAHAKIVMVVLMKIYIFQSVHMTTISDLISATELKSWLLSQVVKWYRLIFVLGVVRSYQMRSFRLRNVELREWWRYKKERRSIVEYNTLLV